jgi:hypothetical protein
MNFKKTLLVLVFGVLTMSKSIAQKSVTDQNLVWYGYFLTLQWNKKWYIQSEVQERHYVDPSAQHQFLIRNHLHRTLGNSGWETSAGFCFFLQSPNDPEAPVKLTVPELRPHLEFAQKQKLKYVTLDHRYRFEARYFHNTNATRTALEEGYDFGNFRFRYRVQATVPIWKIDAKKTLKLKISDEIHLNAGQKIVKNVYDQNRLYAGLSLDLLPNFTIDAGYLNWFQQRPSGDFFNRNILRFAIYHKINLEKPLE